MKAPSIRSINRTAAYPIRKETVYYEDGYHYYDPVLDACNWALTLCFCFQLGALAGS